jgi:hypothetical protein
VRSRRQGAKKGRGRSSRNALAISTRFEAATTADNKRGWPVTAVQTLDLDEMEADPT